MPSSIYSWSNSFILLVSAWPRLLCLMGDLREYDLDSANRLFTWALTQVMLYKLGMIAWPSTHGECHMSKLFKQIEACCSHCMWLKPSNKPFLVHKNKLNWLEIPKGLNWLEKSNQSHLVKPFHHLCKK